MEVEAFDHSNQMKQERDGQNPKNNHQNIMDSFELATSKPLNSSRVMLNRRFQNQNQQEKSNQFGTLQLENP